MPASRRRLRRRLPRGSARRSSARGLAGRGLDPIRGRRPVARIGPTIHTGVVQDVDLPEASYDLALLIMTIEHVADPGG